MVGIVLKLRYLEMSFKFLLAGPFLTKCPTLSNLAEKITSNECQLLFYAEVCLWGWCKGDSEN